MGCKMTKLLKSDGDPKEEYKEPLPEPPAPNALDPRLPLTAKQKFSIIKSWKAISRALGPTGVNMFMRLFEENQDILQLFDKFKELKTRDAQAQSLELAEHATIVMNSIDEGMQAMDNVDFFFDLLHQIGAAHRKLPGFKKEYFWKIERPFLEAVKTTLDERYSDNIEKIYKIAIRFIIETVIEGYDRAAPNKEVNDNVTDEKESKPSGKGGSCPVVTQISTPGTVAILNIKTSANATYTSINYPDGRIMNTTNDGEKTAGANNSATTRNVTNSAGS